MSTHRFKFRYKFKKEFKELTRVEKFEQIKDLKKKIELFIQFLTDTMIDSRLFAFYFFELNSNSLKEFLSSD
jgi:hypothetical protein